MDTGHLISDLSGTMGIVYRRRVSRGRDLKKGERYQEIGTCQDSETRGKEWIGSMKKRKEEIQREPGSERSI